MSREGKHAVSHKNKHHSKHDPEHETEFVHGGGGMPGSSESHGHVESHKQHQDHVRETFHGK